MINRNVDMNICMHKTHWTGAYKSWFCQNLNVVSADKTPGLALNDSSGKNEQKKKKRNTEVIPETFQSKEVGACLTLQ